MWTSGWPVQRVWVPILHQFRSRCEKWVYYDWKNFLVIYHGWNRGFVMMLKLRREEERKEKTNVRLENKILWECKQKEYQLGRFKYCHFRFIEITKGYFFFLLKFGVFEWWSTLDHSAWWPAAKLGFLMWLRMFHYFKLLTNGTNQKSTNNTWPWNFINHQNLLTTWISKNCFCIQVEAFHGFALFWGQEPKNEKKSSRET